MPVSSKLAEAYVEFSAKMKPLADHMAGAKRAVEGFVRNANKHLDRFATHAMAVGRKASLYLTAPIAAVGTLMAKAAMAAEESENLFAVSMGNMAVSARKWSDEIAHRLGLNAYEIRKNVATFNVMLKSMGLTENAAYDMSRGLTQLAYDLASFRDITPEEAFEKLQAGITGEAEPLKRLGVLVLESITQQAAYTHGIAKQGEKLTEQQKILARYATIMDQTTDAQGDLERTMESATNRLRRLTSQVQVLRIEFGQLLMPVIDRLISITGTAVAWFRNLDEESKKLAVRAALVAAAIGPAAFAIAGIAKAIRVLLVPLTALGKLFVYFHKHGQLRLSIAITGVTAVAALVIELARLKQLLADLDQHGGIDIEKTLKSIEASLEEMEAQGMKPEEAEKKMEASIWDRARKAIAAYKKGKEELPMLEQMGVKGSLNKLNRLKLAMERAMTEYEAIQDIMKRRAEERGKPKPAPPATQPAPAPAPLPPLQEIGWDRTRPWEEQLALWRGREPRRMPQGLRGRKAQAWRRQGEVDIRQAWQRIIKGFRQDHPRMGGIERKALRRMMGMRDEELAGLRPGRRGGGGWRANWASMVNERIIKGGPRTDKPVNEAQGDDILKQLKEIAENTKHPKPAVLGA